MSDAEQTCLQATRLFALAIKACEDGSSANVNELTKLASEAFDHEPPARSGQARQLGFAI
jgi:hypothetical protein